MWKNWLLCIPRGPSAPAVAVSGPLCWFRSLSRFFCSGVCGTARWIGSSVLVLRKTVSTVDGEILFLILNTTRRPVVNLSDPQLGTCGLSTWSRLKILECLTLTCCIVFCSCAALLSLGMSTPPDFTFCLVCMIFSLKFLCSIVLRSEILSGFFALIMYACVRGNVWWILCGVCLLVTRKHLMETLPSCCNIFLLCSESPLEATHWSGQHVLGHKVESITRACLISLSRCFSGFGDCHKSLSQGHYDNVVHIYQRSYILASVNGVEIYPRMLNMN